MARTTIQSDSFTGSGALGANWANLQTAVRGDVQFDGSNNRITGAFAGLADDHPIARWVGSGTFTDDQFSSLELLSLSNISSTIRAGVVARAGAGTGSSSTCYEAFIWYNGSGSYTTVLALRNGASYTTLHSATVSWANSDTIDIECEGTTIRLCKNGTPLGGSFTVTDSTLTTGQPGVIATANAFGDNWVGGTISTPTAPVLSSATSTYTGTTTANAGATIDTVSGSGSRVMYALPRIGGSVASSASIIASGATLAVTTNGAKSVALTGLTTNSTYVADVVYVDATNGTSNVVTTPSFTPRTPIAFSGTVGSQSGVTGGSFSLDLSTFFTGSLSRTYAVQSGSLSGSGLTLNTSSGVISGTLAAVAVYTVTVRATDSISATADTNSFTITISSTGTAPTVSTNPTNTTVTAGDTATMTAAASGSPTPTVQWQENTGSWSNISGQTSTTLSLGVVGVPDNGRVFRAVFTNSSGTATTTSATLTVNAATGDGTLTSEPLRRNNGSLVGATTLTWLGVRNDSTGADLLVMTSVAVNSSSIFTTGANAAFAIGQTYAVHWKESGGAHGQATVIAT